MGFRSPQSGTFDRQITQYGPRHGQHGQHATVAIGCSTHHLTRFRSISRIDFAHLEMVTPSQSFGMDHAGTDHLGRQGGKVFNGFHFNPGESEGFV